MSPGRCVIQNDKGRGGGGGGNSTRPAVFGGIGHPA